MPEPIVSDHPLVSHHIAQLRDASTPPATFRQIVRRLTMVLAYEATRDLRTAPVTVRTPLAEAAGQRLASRIAVAPILRAGHGMVEPIMDLIPEAAVWHLGVYRDEQTLEPVEYYHKLPKDRPPDVALVVDPMLATGGSAVWAIDALRDWGAATVKLMSLIAAPEGIENVRRRHEQTHIHVCHVDDRLDEHGYIVPGLGDAGDRLFNTER